jgi:excisionase family DNA binding protein
MEERDAYSASEAAKVLKLSTRRVRQLAETEEIEGTRDAEGNWRLDKASVHTFRDERRLGSSKPREGTRRRSKRPDSSTAWDRVTELERALGRLEGEMRARAELTATTESTLRESLERERERADRLEEITEQLRGELEAERSKGFWSRLFGG